MNTGHLPCLSAEADAAAGLLFRTLGAHRTAVKALKNRPLSRLNPVPTDDPIQDRRQATFIRLLSITESFAAELLFREVDRDASNAQSVIIAKVAESALIQGTNSWRDQKESYKRWLGLEKFDWTTVERLAEARNAVAHGLGKLTRRQLRNAQSVKDRLNQVGISVVDDRVVLTDDDLAATAKACREFIKQLDANVWAVRTKM